MSDGLPTIAGFWDAAADRFDQEPDHGLSESAVKVAWWERLVSWAPGARADVLDVGCGTGALSLLLAECGHCLTLLDLSRRMVALAHAKLRACGVAPRLLLGDDFRELGPVSANPMRSRRPMRAIAAAAHGSLPLGSIRFVAAT